MTEDKLAFLEAAPAASDPVAQPEAQPPEAAPQAAPAITPEAPKPPETPPPAIQSKPEPKGEGHTVPLPKYLDTYNENRELKKQLAELRQQAEAAKAQAPDPLLDPEGFASFTQGNMQQTFQAQMEGMRLDMSEQLTRQAMGDEAVNEALAFFNENVKDKDHLTHQRILRAQNPWGEMVKWYRQQSLLNRIGDPSKFDDFVRAEYARLNQQAQPGAAQPPLQPRAPVVPPPSLSRAPAAPSASSAPAGPGVAFDSTFSR